MATQAITSESPDAPPPASADVQNGQQGQQGQVADYASLLAELAKEQQLRQQAEQQLAFEHLLLHTLVENCPFRIYAKDCASRFVLTLPQQAPCANTSV